ncbi:hypothetical protein, partial [Neorhizobium sp. 2083]|uniref:hypothetical protein n=1 Tax=Neorhizobium sp. 2083 TaxID=2817762 RepID=UPI00286C90CE
MVVLVGPNLHIQTVEVDGNRRQTNFGYIARTGRTGDNRAIVDDVDLEVVLDDVAIAVAGGCREGEGQ